MVSFPKAIEFQYLANQLSDTEFETFLFDLMDSLGREFILSALFSKFTMQNSEKQYGEIDFVNKLLLYIIAMRNEEEYISFDPIPNEDELCLDELSSTLIGEIASFLELSDYASFEQCNRLIHIGCNMPNTLKKINLTKYHNCSSIDLNRYPYLQSLTFPFDKFYQFLSLSNTVFNHLESLTLCAHYLDSIHGDDILLFLSKCPNLRELKLRDVYVRDENFGDDKSVNSIALSNCIRSLSIRGDGTCFGKFHSFLIQMFGDRLTELSFDDGFEISDIVKFADLKSLHIGIDVGLNGMENIEKICKRSPNLERVVCDLNDFDGVYFELRLGPILTKDSLKEIDIGTFDIDKVCNGLNDDLMGNKDILYDSDDEVVHDMTTCVNGEVECKRKSKRMPKICIVYKWKMIKNEKITLDEYDLKLRLGIIKILKLMRRFEEKLTIAVYWDPGYKPCFDTFEKTFAEYLNDTRFSYNHQCLSFYR